MQRPYLWGAIILLVLVVLAGLLAAFDLGLFTPKPVSDGTSTQEELGPLEPIPYVKTVSVAAAAASAPPAQQPATQPAAAPPPPQRTFTNNSESTVLDDQAIVPTCDAADQAGVGFAGACQLCDLVKLTHNLINFAVAFTTIVATLMFTYAGLLYFTASANPENIKKAHGIFMKVFGGLVIILAAWLVIDILVRTLAGEKIGEGRPWGPWNEIQCAPYPSGGQLQTEAPGPTGVIGGAGGAGGAGQGGRPFNEEEEVRVREELARRNIAINHCEAGSTSISDSDNDGNADCAVCRNPATSGCTNVGYLSPAVISGLQQIRQRCGATTVTGGTEQGPHRGHTGNQVDIRFIAADEYGQCIHDNARTFGITRICTTSRDSEFRINCEVDERVSHLHLEF